MAKQKGKKRRNTALNLIFSLLLIAVIGAGLYYAAKSLLTHRENHPKPEESSTAQESVQETMPETTAETAAETTNRFPAKAETGTETVALCPTAMLSS